MPSALHPPNLCSSKHKVTSSSPASLSSDTPGAQLPSREDKNVAVKAARLLLEAPAQSLDLSKHVASPHCLHGGAQRTCRSIPPWPPRTPWAHK